MSGDIPHKCPGLRAAEDAVRDAIIESIRAQLAADIAAVRAHDFRIREWLRWAHLRKLIAASTALVTSGCIIPPTQSAMACNHVGGAPSDRPASSVGYCP